MYTATGVFGGIGNITGLQVQYWDVYQYAVYPWFMFLLFIISGISSRLYLNNHTGKQFIKSRTTKLLVPSTIGLFVFWFIQGYISMSFGDAFDTLTGVPGIVLYAFLACVFLILIISGIASFFTAKRLKNAIVDETEIKNEILDFCKHEAVETANKMLGKGGGNDLYFARVDFLKSAIKREPKFKNVDDVTIDGLLDENYSELFPDED